MEVRYINPVNHNAVDIPELIFEGESYESGEVIEMDSASYDRLSKYFVLEVLDAKSDTSTGKPSVGGSGFAGLVVATPEANLSEDQGNSVTGVETSDTASKSPNDEA